MRHGKATLPSKKHAFLNAFRQSSCASQANIGLEGALMVPVSKCRF
jgi:hypothetical protein